ncbi:Uncharacterized OsmC-related protein [Chelatococcus sambhunathii]|uniref:Uncharacterized OsmC-related protein n=2 Tax=Chelatococcus sambhunathii TaxID=363953 RepID=A0ABP2A0P5_9HYPH|nr:OsmC family protein [Chelatococcus sp. XZ-Ab1]CUA86144.1 Uncharacterized OsmC-related protein [Chelatococcus sambhunathii]
MAAARPGRQFLPTPERDMHTTTHTTAMTMDKPARKEPPPPRNGVDTPTLFATINAVAGQAELARFRFRARSRWVSGTHSVSTMKDFFGAGAEQSHATAHEAHGDHPAVLCGADQGPTPVEYLLSALAACLTSGIANIAAARGVTLHKVEATVEGDIDLRGILGLSKEVRNGYEGIRAQLTVAGDAPKEKLEEIVAQARARSAVFDVLTNGVPVTVGISA